MTVAWKAGLLGLAVGCGGAAEAGAPPPPVVRVAEVVRGDVPVLVEAVGQTRGSETVEVRARVEGFVERVAFTEGAPVEKGDLLYVIDPRTYQAAVARARATVAQAEALFRRAAVEERRLEPLAASAAISRSEYDDALANLQTSRANLDAAKAALQTAQLDLSYTRIDAPIAGVAGFTLVQPGNLVGRGENTLLTTLSQLDPIWVRFAISEREYLALYRRSLERGQAPGEAAAAAPDDPDAPRIRMLLADGSEHPHPGTFRVADRAVDPTTGTLGLEVSFPNPDGVVRPGQFARVVVQTGVERGALLVPQRAVRELQGSFSVAVVGAEGALEVRPVTPSRRHLAFYVIPEGVAEGERVVIEGIQRARTGMKVVAEPVALGPDGLPLEEQAARAAPTEAPARGDGD